MQIVIKFSPKVAILITIGVLFSSFFIVQKPENGSLHFPYKKAGLTEKQAAAHLLSRFSYGATPGQVDELVNIGLEKWFQQQLNADLPDDSLNLRLEGFETLKMSNTAIVNNFPRPAQVLRMAIKDGVIDKDSISKGDKKDFKEQVAAYAKQKGIKPQQELFRQFINQKILRAAYSNNQLQEVLTDFWFNHFNVSLTKNDCAVFIPAYERDVIRPNVFGKFEDILLATAKSPAMLLYLDNFSSSAANADARPATRRARQKPGAQPVKYSDTSSTNDEKAIKIQKIKKAAGLNENYAREVMELHTLGVDGGYTQQDVTQAARVLTGWTIYPMSDYGYGNNIKQLIDRVGEDKLAQRGFVHDGDFFFAVNRHDTNEKKVLGNTFAANGGYNEGLELLYLLATNTSTAKFIVRKIAVRFVSDNPSQALIDKMVKTFIEKNGDTRQVLLTMVTSPEFWQKDALREKTKSPFELSISAVRSLNANIIQPYQLYNWITKMGQKMYFYQAPTGFPDKGTYWINTGALLNRMNFGLALASQRIPGIQFDLAALNNHREPESAEAALVVYSKLFMPERNLDETIKRLTPLLNDPNLTKKVDEAAGKTVLPSATAMEENAMMMNEDIKEKKLRDKPGKREQRANGYAYLQLVRPNNSMLSQVVGIIIGSPEFQRR
ncbi:MAG: DUF1800 domain-containing protein [Chitinophagaceae bacterium]